MVDGQTWLGWLADWLACMHAGLAACLAGWLPAWLAGCLPAWLPGCLSACLPVCLAGQDGWRSTWLAGTHNTSGRLSARVPTAQMLPAQGRRDRRGGLQGFDISLAVGDPLVRLVFVRWQTAGGGRGKRQQAAWCHEQR